MNPGIHDVHRKSAIQQNNNKQADPYLKHLPGTKTAFTGQDAQVKQATDIHQVVRQVASSLILVIQGTTQHRGEATTLPGREGESGARAGLRGRNKNLMLNAEEVGLSRQNEDVQAIGRECVVLKEPGGLVLWTCRAGREKEVHEWGLAKLY